MSASTISERDSTIAGWLLATKGYFTINWKFKRIGEKRYFYLCPTIGITDNRKELLERFYEIVKVGTIYRQGLPNPSRKHINWVWQLQNHKQIINLLENSLQYFPFEVPQAELMLEYCKSRQGLLLHTPYLNREKEIVEEVKKLNQARRDK